ncbi:MAG: sugar phosphate nucleotidyltransferase [Solirubrobacterales bacterium]
MDPVAILCGGRGTRLQEHTHAIPKALVEIGGKPIIWHVVRIYAAQGFRRFLLLTGYLGEMIEESVEAMDWPEPVEIECLDTGLDTPTGGRFAVARERLEGGPFCATYADGVADIDLGALVSTHREHGRLATMTVVRPYSQWGIAVLSDENRVEGFAEKPRLDYWINGGFFCFEPGALEYMGETSVLEQEPLAGLADDRQLHAFRHPGFWECMDTYKDAVTLNDAWGDGRAPWAVWEPEVARSGAR